MDLIRCLEIRGCHHLLSLIFCRLSSPELSACAQVSRSWSLLVQELVWANKGVRGRVVRNKQRGAFICTEQVLGRSESSQSSDAHCKHFYSSCGMEKSSSVVCIYSGLAVSATSTLCGCCMSGRAGWSAGSGACCRGGRGSEGRRSSAKTRQGLLTCHALHNDFKHKLNPSDL